MLGVHTQLLYVRSMVQLVRWSIEQQLALTVCNAHHTMAMYACTWLTCFSPHTVAYSEASVCKWGPPTGARVTPQHSSAGRKSTARTMSGKY